MNPKLELLGKAATVGALSLAERVRPPQVRTRDDVPLSGAHLNVAWLSDVLCRDVPGAAVESFSTPAGSSGTSERLALQVRYNQAGDDAGLPTELFTKSTASFKQRLVLGGAGAIHGETHFYMGLRDKAAIEAPRGYWAGVDERSWRSIAIMEDIASLKGATFMEPVTPFTEDEIRDLVYNLARMHGALWGDPATGGLKTPHDYLARTMAFLDIRKRAAVGMERSRSVMPPALLGQEDRLHEATVRSMDLSTNCPRTLLHGDCHAGQTYRTAAGAMGIADWQAVLQGGWAFDVAYLVNSACEPADRRAWQDGLIEAYVEELHAHGGPKLSFEQAFLEYRQQAFWPYTAWAFTIGRAAYQPEMQPVPTCLAIVRRTAAAIDELDAFAALEERTGAGVP